MDYQSINKKKEDFRRYLERGGVVDALTKVLVMLYEEPERPVKPLEFIRDNLVADGSGKAGLQQEVEQLRREIQLLKEKYEGEEGGE